MNIPSKGNIRIKINTLHKYAPIVKAIIASFYSIQDVYYPWESWIPMPLGSFERGQKVVISAPSPLRPEDNESIDGVFQTEQGVDQVYALIHKETERYYGHSVCSVEVFAC